MIYKGTRRAKRFTKDGRNITMLIKGGRQAYPCIGKLKIGQLEYRITDDGLEKWFEVGFALDSIWTGNATTGWTDAAGFVKLDLERSENLTAWATGEFVNCAGSPALVGTAYAYWARSHFPVDSEEKIGVLTCESNGGDARNNPFTSITINNIVQTLPHYPYTMPTDAAQLQADLRAAGWTGATVVATSATVWTITISTVHQTDYSTTSRVAWPVYYVADMYGALTTAVNGRDFTGEFVNEAGVRTAVPKQFARLRISQGPNFQP